MKTKIDVIRCPLPQETSTVRILKRSACPSVSGKSSLVYEVGLDERTKELQLRVVANSGGGCFNQDWVKLKDITAALDKAPKGESVTSYVLESMFRGVSQNTAGFVWAVLVHAGFVVPSKEKKRAYDRVDPKEFMDEIRALADGKAPDAKAKKAKAPPAVHTETPSASTKKKKTKS